MATVKGPNFHGMDDESLAFGNNSVLNTTNNISIVGNPAEQSNANLMMLSQQTEHYHEWDCETMKQDENFEISSEAREYNNQDMDESRIGIDIVPED